MYAFTTVMISVTHYGGEGQLLPVSAATLGGAKVYPTTQVLIENDAPHTHTQRDKVTMMAMREPSEDPPLLQLCIMWLSGMQAATYPRAAGVGLAHPISHCWRPAAEHRLVRVGWAVVRPGWSDLLGWLGWYRRT